MHSRRSYGSLVANERLFRELLVTRDICSQNKNDSGVRTRVVNISVKKRVTVLNYFVALASFGYKL